jgi:hypothetical protein
LGRYVDHTAVWECCVIGNVVDYQVCGQGVDQLRAWDLLYVQLMKSKDQLTCSLWSGNVRYPRCELDQSSSGNR